ncbi:hypothetical protein AB0M43_36600 [Longispora sp. NPDC051575]|uniref:hypothetical protein n=1 Tax=Longispora sp. NPDC051575 TaxID=3154943 RepID=UPI00343C3462
MFAMKPPRPHLNGHNPVRPGTSEAWPGSAAADAAAALAARPVAKAPPEAKAASVVVLVGDRIALATGRGLRFA